MAEGAAGGVPPLEWRCLDCGYLLRVLLSHPEIYTYAERVAEAHVETHRREETLRKFIDEHA